jgi:hypothetical protein
MQRIPSSAARTSIAALLAMLIVPIAAHAPERPQPRPALKSLNPHFSILRDYTHSRVKPCLIGYERCASTYPPPTPCLALTQRCWADARLEFAYAQSR